MSDHNIEEMSESEEMYLISIVRLVEKDIEEPIPIPQLAAELSIQPVSVNQMVHKLAEEGWVNYIPYKGVELTAKGEQAALQVLRDRRLWEVFLTEKLNLSSREADALACRLEHLTPQKVTGRLARFLGHPTVTPQGLPIPELNGEDEELSLLPLIKLPPGQRGGIVRIYGDPTVRAFLDAEGIRPGVAICLLAVGGEGAVLLQVEKHQVHLANTVAGTILVTPYGE